jgi:hypothetical protein
MNTFKLTGLLLTSALALTASACDDAGGATGPCMGEASLCATVHVPDDYNAEAVQLIAGLYAAVPPEGPPDVVLKVEPTPMIAPGEPYELVVTDIIDRGEYYVYVALYNEGGGMFEPVAGIDYTAVSDMSMNVGEEGLELGDMQLELAE